MLLARHAKRRGLVEKPRKAARPGARSASWRTIPAAVRREVWRRAGGRCEWQLHEGGACGSTLRLEFAHVTPRARGGPATSENLKLHCRARNGRSGPAGRDRICSSLVGALLQDGRRRAAGPSYAAPLPFPAAMSTSRAAEICTLSPRPPFSRKSRRP